MKRMEVGEMYRVVRAVRSKYFSGCREKWEDLESEGLLALCEAEVSFDESYGVSFLTYGWRCVWCAMMKYLRASEKYERLLADTNGDIECYFVEEDCDVCVCDDVMKMIADASGVMSPKANLIANELLGGKKQCDIADKFGVSRQFVNEIFSKIKENVREKYDYINGELIEK
jgi:DNA-directed RNA polymerase specialized sigma24 family protein